MKKRTPQEVGQIVRQRREWLGLTQENAGISSSLVKQIEGGTAPAGGRGSKRAAFMRALRWPPDAMDRLANGEDPETFEEPSETDDRAPWEAMVESQRQIIEELERLADLIERRLA